MRRLLIGLLLALPAFGQNVPYSDITLSSSGLPVGGAPIAVCSNPGLATTAATVTANVAILTMASNPITAGFVANQAIAVSGFTGADTYFNGGTVVSTGITNNFLILSVTSTQITYALTHANASATTNGSVFQSGSQGQACAPLAAISTDSAGANPITQPGLTSSGLGNYQFYAPPNSYYVQFYGATIGEFIKPLGLSCIPNVSCTVTAPATLTNLTVSGTGTFTGTATTITALDGCQHVNASQTFAAALAAVSNPGCLEVDPGTYTVSANATIPAGVNFRSLSGGLLSIATGVVLTINGTITANTSQLFSYVGTGVVTLGNNAIQNGVVITWFPGSDAYASMNAAYTASPSGPVKFLVPNGPDLVPITHNFLACWDVSTTVTFQTVDKYPTVQGMSPNTCFNWTPTTGVSMKLDYVSPSAAVGITGHGIRDITFINNKCVTTGGCGGSAEAIEVENTNFGNQDAVYDNVSILGFSLAFATLNTNNIGSGYWFNPFFAFNNVAVWTLNLCSPCGVFIGGSVIGNTSFLQAQTASGGEINLVNTQFGTNIGPLFDLTRNTPSKMFITCTGCHFEDSPTVSANSPHYVSGLGDMRIYGGIMETDQASGTQDCFICLTAGSVLEIHGLVLSSPGKSFTQAFSLPTTARGNIQVTNNTPTTIPTLCGGTGCAGSIVFQVSSNVNSTLQMSNLTVNGTASFPGNTAALTADWTCGTGGTVSSCTSATIIGSGGGVPLTFTLPLVAQAYTLVCDGVVGQATAVTANQWNLLTATNGATNVTANYTMATAATAYAAGAVTDQASTTTTFQIAPSWTLGGTATKMPFHIWAKIEGASASGTVLSLQLLAPTAADLVTIYRGTSCRIF